VCTCSKDSMANDSHAPAPTSGLAIPSVGRVRLRPCEPRAQLLSRTQAVAMIGASLGGALRKHRWGGSDYGRTYAEGKKITWNDGVRGLWCIFRYTWFA
jgi:hypothetical protein